VPWRVAGFAEFKGLAGVGKQLATHMHLHALANGVKLDARCLWHSVVPCGFFSSSNMSLAAKFVESHALLITL